MTVFIHHRIVLSIWFFIETFRRSKIDWDSDEFESNIDVKKTYSSFPSESEQRSSLVSSHVFICSSRIELLLRSAIRFSLVEKVQLEKENLFSVFNFARTEFLSISFSLKDRSDCVLSELAENQLSLFPHWNAAKRENSVDKKSHTWRRQRLF